MLRKIVGEAYEAFLSVEAMEHKAEHYQRLRARLQSDKVKLHADSPSSAVVVRSVFPSLDASRVSKYARALDAAKAASITPDKFPQFVVDAGGFEKIRLPAIAVLVPGKPAKPESMKDMVPPAPYEEEDDLNDEELEQLEYGDEMYELLEARKANPILVVDGLTDAQLERLDQSTPTRIVLVAELHEGQLRVFEQIPFNEESMSRAYRERFPTCNDLRNALDQETQ